MRMRRRIGVEDVNANYLVVGARRQVLVIARESNSVDGARVCAKRGELLRLRVFCVVGIEDGLHRPYSYMGICRK
jgi:hypothetical protein